MMTKLCSLLSASALAIMTPRLHAQIVYKQGKPASWSSLQDINPPPIAAMPAFDLDAIRQEDAVNDMRKDVPFRFAIPHAVNFGTENSGRWDDMDDGRRMWRLELSSPGAVSMNVIFDQFKLTPGGQVFIYNTGRTQVIGPFTHQNNLPWGSLATTPVDGDGIVVEYIKPAGSAAADKLSIGQVAHGYRGFGEMGQPFGASGACNNNTICPEWNDWRNQIKSVVLLLRNGSSFCSGTLLNNTSKDGAPIISTANHCTSGSVDNWAFMFNWDSPKCTPTTNAPKDHTVSGATLLVKNSGSDFSLVKMSSKPPVNYNVYYSGWDASGAAVTSAVSIHHPRGDIKKISKDNNPAVKSGNFWSVVWEDGTTEPGSSGSGLFDQNQRFIGQLLGGGASCSNTSSADRYGRVEASWGLGASKFLDPGNTGLKVMDGMPAGPPSTAVVADFTPSTLKSCDGSVTFTNTSSNATSWSWDFGDGSISSVQSPPAHTYAVDGTYKVTLTVQGATAVPVTKSVDIVVTRMGEVTVKGDSVCAGKPATLLASVATGATVAWYRSLTSTAVLASGLSYTTPAINTATSYYAIATAGDCKTARLPAPIIIKPSSQCVVGLGEGLASGEFSVFPELNDGVVFIRHSQAAAMEVVDLAGHVRAMVELRAGLNEVDLRSLRGGIYILRIKSPVLIVRRMVKGF